LRRTICRAFLSAGLGLLAVGLCFGIYAIWFLHVTIATEGTVLSLRAIHDDEYTVESNTGSKPAGFEPGQHVRVLYETSRPTRAKIASFGQIWLFPLLSGIIGMIATAVGYFLLQYERRRNPEFTFLPSWRPTTHKPDLHAHLLGGPKFDNFEVDRDRDTGRNVSL
jgi:hypothetical protein